MAKSKKELGGGGKIQFSYNLRGFRSIYKVRNIRRSMKKWAKICVWVGIAWIILVFVGLLILYLNLYSIANDMSSASSRATMMNPNYAWFLSTINLSSPINSLFRWFVLLIIPSVILWIVAGIWGREKKIGAA